MASDDDVMAQVREAFAGCKRPGHFTNHEHCSECAEHDALLCARDRDTLAIADVNNPGWDPICFVSLDGFRYYLPALCRLALEPYDPRQGWYGDQLLFHLCHDGPRNARFLACTAAQRRAVADLLRHLVDTRAYLADDRCVSDDLLCAIDIWSDPGP